MRKCSLLIEVPVLVLFVLLPGMIARGDSTETQPIVFITSNGDYALADPRSMEITLRGNLLREKKIPPSLLRKIDPTWSGGFTPVVVSGFIPDVAHGHIFLELAYPRSTTLYGYAVLSYPKLNFVHLLRPGDMGSADLLVNPSTGEVYLTSISSKDAEKTTWVTPMTRIYDPGTWKARSFALAGTDLWSACFLEEGKEIYSRGKIFASVDGREIEKTADFSGSLLVGCRGNEAFWASKEHGRAVLTGGTLTSERPRIRIASDDAMEGFIPHEWVIGSDGRFVARMVAKPLRGFVSYSGRIAIFNVEKQTQSDLQLPTKRTSATAYHYWRIAFSDHGDKLVVIADKHVFVIDLETTSLRRSIKLPFIPLRVVWP